jgi:hypothetical protein
MNFLKKSYHFIYGFFLFIWFSRKLDLNRIFKDKRIAIVGAASSASGTGKGAYIDGFDLVIRINKAPQLLKNNKGTVDIGSKADILFHSFFENEQSGGGVLDVKMFDSLGIRFIVNPIAAYSGYRVIFNFYKKYLLHRITYRTDKRTYQQLVLDLKGFQPTIGFCALKACLESEFSELFITGFTFFKTAFADGYRDDIKESKDVRNFIKKAGLHNPDLEFEFFLKLLQENAQKNIVMDDTLTSIVNSYTKT